MRDLFILFMGFSRQEYWSGLPFPSPVDHILSQLSTMTHPSWVALHGVAHSFIELDKTVVHVLDWLVLCDFGFQSVCPMMDKDKRLMEASWWERLTEGETESCSDWWGLLSKSFIQFSVAGWSCVPSLLFTWAKLWLEVMKIMVRSEIRSVAQSCPTLCNPINRSTPGLPVHHQLPEFTETHIHRVSDAIQPSHPLSSPSPLAPNPSQHQNLFQWVNSSHEVAKVLEFQL